MCLFDCFLYQTMFFFTSGIKDMLDDFKMEQRRDFNKGMEQIIAMNEVQTADLIASRVEQAETNILTRL